MKKVVIIFLLTVTLTGCNRIGEYIAAQFAIGSFEPSTIEQDLKSEQLYAALQQQQHSLIMSLLSQKLKDELNTKPDVLNTIMQAIPNEAATSVEVINTTREFKLGEGKYTKVVYAYQYPQRMVYFTVVFDGVENSTEIVGVHIQTTVMNENNLQAASTAEQSI